MGGRFPEAVPGRQIPLLVLCRCVSPSVRFVVAKSALLRFRLRRKLHLLPCSSSPHKVYDFAGTPTGHGILLRRDSCSDGHSVVVFATFLLLDFGLCMRKGKSRYKKPPTDFSPQSVMYLLNEICVLYRHQIFSSNVISL